MLARSDYSSERIIADKGERIYQDLFQDQYETRFPGQVVVIEVVTKRAYVSATAEGAINKATENAPDGLFHMVKIQGTPSDGVQSYFRKLRDFIRRLSKRS